MNLRLPTDELAAQFKVAALVPSAVTKALEMKDFDEWELQTAEWALKAVSNCVCPPSCFMGIELKYKPAEGTLSLSQTKYITDAFEKFCGQGTQRYVGCPLNSN